MITGPRRRHKRVYRQRDYATPYEKLRRLPGWEKYLKQGVRPEQLERRALEGSDTEAAQAMQTAKQKLLVKARSAAGLPTETTA